LNAKEFAAKSDKETPGWWNTKHKVMVALELYSNIKVAEAKKPIDPFIKKILLDLQKHYEREGTQSTVALEFAVAIAELIRQHDQP